MESYGSTPSSKSQTSWKFEFRDDNKLFIATSNVPGGFILDVDVSSESELEIPKAFCISFMFTQIFLNLPNPGVVVEANGFGFALKLSACIVKNLL